MRLPPNHRNRADTEARLEWSGLLCSARFRGERMSRSEELLFPSRKERFEDRRKEIQQRKLRDEFFDHATLLAISKLVTQGQFESIDFPISTGKEGGVFRATAANGFRAVKVYRISNSIFRRLPAHVLDELRREVRLSNRARVIYAWTRREHTVLRRLADAQVRCPTPAGYFRNVLVMEFIGTSEGAAPRLHDAVVDDPAGVFDALLAEIRCMVERAKLVHGDLSPYNVLLFEGRPVLIDVAQSIPSDHPQAGELLRRDLRNFARFFARLGVKRDPETMFVDVGGSQLQTGG